VLALTKYVLMSGWGRGQQWLRPIALSAGGLAQTGRSTVAPALAITRGRSDVMAELSVLPLTPSVKPPSSKVDF
jgi:hypothetical protein